MLVEVPIKGGYFKKNTLQKYIRTTWWFLFIPIFTYDKRID